MATPSQPEITQLLAAWSDGDPSALEQWSLAQAWLFRELSGEKKEAG